MLKLCVQHLLLLIALPGGLDSPTLLALLPMACIASLVGKLEKPSYFLGKHSTFLAPPIPSGLIATFILHPQLQTMAFRTPPPARNQILPYMAWPQQLSGSLAQGFKTPLFLFLLYLENQHHVDDVSLRHGKDVVCPSCSITAVGCLYFCGKTPAQKAVSHQGIRKCSLFGNSLFQSVVQQTLLPQVGALLSR